MDKHMKKYGKWILTVSMSPIAILVLILLALVKLLRSLLKASLLFIIVAINTPFAMMYNVSILVFEYYILHFRESIGCIGKSSTLHWKSSDPRASVGIEVQAIVSDFFQVIAAELLVVVSGGIITFYTAPLLVFYISTTISLAAISHKWLTTECLSKTAFACLCDGYGLNPMMFLFSYIGFFNIGGHPVAKCAFAARRAFLFEEDDSNDSSKEDDTNDSSSEEDDTHDSSSEEDIMPCISHPEVSRDPEVQEAPYLPSVPCISPCISHPEVSRDPEVQEALYLPSELRISHPEVSYLPTVPYMSHPEVSRDPEVREDFVTPKSHSNFCNEILFHLFKKKKKKTHLKEKTKVFGNIVDEEVGLPGYHPFLQQVITDPELEPGHRIISSKWNAFERGLFQLSPKIEIQNIDLAGKYILKSFMVLKLQEHFICEYLVERLELPEDYSDDKANKLYNFLVTLFKEDGFVTDKMRGRYEHSLTLLQIVEGVQENVGYKIVDPKLKKEVFIVARCIDKQ